MNELNDEILNKYIDGELDQPMLNEVREQLKNSEADRLRFTMLQKVHSELGKLKTFEVRDNFTSTIMSKLQKKARSAWKDRFFLFSITSLFLIPILSILGYIVIMSISQSGNSSQYAQDINTYTTYILNISSSVKGIITPKNISIIGSILSFGIIITGYLFFENQRQTKRNLSKLH
jgi:hypothetical protein